ncbi:hypothetical protein GCM10027168_54370 [Streptomyces capparidis]
MPVVAGSVPSSREESSTADVIGAVVLVCCVLWALISAMGRDARPEGFLLALLAVVAGYAAGRIAGAVLPVAAPGAAAVAVVLVVAADGGLSGDGAAPPLGYGNANAALLVLAAGAACCAAWATGSRGLRTGLRLLALAAAGLALALGSLLGCAAAVGVLLCSLAAARTRRLPGLAGLALCALTAVGATLLVATHALPAATTVETQLTRARVELWHDAADLVERDPVRGVGPDRFAEESAAARGQVATSKTHSAALQQAAEQGVPGLGLLACAYLWMLYALWRSSRSTPVVLTAGAALTGLAALASVDTVLSYAAVTAGAGLLAGVATARLLADERVPEEAEPDPLPVG